MIIRHIPSRYRHGIAAPTAAMVAKFGWGWTPLRYVSRKPPDEEKPKALKTERAPECQPLVVMPVVRKPVVRAPRRRGPAAPWELRRAEYLARKEAAS